MEAPSLLFYSLPWFWELGAAGKAGLPQDEAAEGILHGPLSCLWFQLQQSLIQVPMGSFHLDDPRVCGGTPGRTNSVPGVLLPSLGIRST